MEKAFYLAAKNKLNNYIGVKYHIKTEFPGQIRLHFIILKKDIAAL